MLKKIKGFFKELFQKHEILIETDKRSIKTPAEVTNILTEYAIKNNLSLTILEESLMPTIKLNEKIYNVRLDNCSSPLYYYGVCSYENKLAYYYWDNAKLYLYPKIDDN